MFKVDFVVGLWNAEMDCAIDSAIDTLVSGDGVVCNSVCEQFH